MLDMLKTSAAALLAAAAIALSATPASADSVEDFYKDRQVTILVSFSAGGGYDLYARTVGEFLGKHIPGNPTIIVQHMPGAGGAKAANFFTHAAPQDGSMIGLMANGAPIGQRLLENVKYDTSKFHYLGRAASMESAIIVWHEAGIENADEWKQKEVIFGATGKANQDYYVPRLAGELLGMKVKMVLGYRGSSPINKAMEQGEVHAFSQSWDSVVTRRGDWIKGNKINVLAYNGLVKPPGAPDAPLLVDLAKNEEDKTIFRLIASAPAVGRAFSAPPGTPPERVAALREAFDATMKDPAFLAEAKKRKMNLNYLPADELQKIVEETVKAPQSAVERMKKLL